VRRVRQPFSASGPGTGGRWFSGPDEAVGQVIVDQTDRLHQRVRGRRPEEPDPAPLQLLGHGHRLRRSGPPVFGGRSRPIDDLMAEDERDEVLPERAHHPSVVDRSFDLSPIADDASIRHQPFDTRRRLEPIQRQVGLRKATGQRQYGTGFPILPKARSDDGVLDVCVLPCSSRVQLIRWFLLAATGEHIGSEGVVYTTGQRVRVTSQSTVPVQIDGDPGGHTPLDIQMLPTRLPFIVTRAG